MIKLIVFDVWQTLAFRDAGYNSTSKMLEVTHASIPKEKFVKIFEESVQTRRWKSKHEAYENLCRNMGLKTTEKNVKTLMEIRDKAEAKTKLYQHTIPMLRQLKTKGYKTAIVSNSSVFAFRQIRKKTRLLKYIDFPLFSFQVGVIKPDKKFFTEILRISRCKAEETIMIGDKLKDDVIPAKDIGMNTILFKDYNTLKKDLSDFGVNLN